MRQKDKTKYTQTIYTIGGLLIIYKQLFDVEFAHIIFGNFMHKMSQICKLSNTMKVRSIKKNISIFKNDYFFLLITPK